jgi:spore germination protein KC
MKKRGVLIILLCMSLLTGCASGSIYSNYRDIERLLVVQTIGLDLAADGRLLLSVSTGKFGSEPPFRLSAEADTISEAQELLQDYLPDKELFYPHVSYIVVGEAAARAGLGGLMDFIARSVETRIDTPVFIVKGGSAENLVLRAGGESHGVTEVLSSLEQSIRLRGNGELFSAVDMSRAQSDSGAALLCALECESAGDVSAAAADGELTAVPAGFAVFSGCELRGFVPDSAARGVSLLMGEAGGGSVEIPAEGGDAAVAIDGGRAEITPVWDTSGRVREIRVHVTLTGGLAEMRAPEMLSKAYLDSLDNALSGEAKSWVTTVLKVSRSLGADFLGLGKKLEAASPKEYRAMPEPFSEQLGEMVFTVDADARVERSYDLSDPQANTADQPATARKD